MNSWRDAILKEFTPQAARLTIAADPDGLLLEEEVLKEIAERGFELMAFEDHVAFRYAYESRHRSRWDQGDHADLVVGVRAPASDVRALPHDLLQAGRQVSFTLGELFPNLSYPVIGALERSHLDALYEGQLRKPPARPLGDGPTAGVRPASRLRDRARDDQAGIRSAPFVAAAPLPRSPCSPHPRRSSPPAAETEPAVRNVAAERDRHRSRRVLRVPAGALAALPRSAGDRRELHP